VTSNTDDDPGPAAVHRVVVSVAQLAAEARIHRRGVGIRGTHPEAGDVLVGPGRRAIGVQAMFV
jgi:hypothetical protein